MIEAERKARVGDPAAVRAKLAAMASGERATYRDTYYDCPDARLDAEGREIRLRTIETDNGERHLLTYKQPPADASGSKPEHETTVGEKGPVDVMLRDLGLEKFISLTKACENFQFDHSGWPMLATLVTVPELDGVFIEVETMTDEANLAEATGAVMTVLEHLGVQDDIDTDTYTGAVRRARAEH